MQLLILHFSSKLPAQPHHVSSGLGQLFNNYMELVSLLFCKMRIRMDAPPKMEVSTREYRWKRLDGGKLYANSSFLFLFTVDFDVYKQMQCILECACLLFNVWSHWHFCSISVSPESEWKELAKIFARKRVMERFLLRSAYSPKFIVILDIMYLRYRVLCVLHLKQHLTSRELCFCL